MIYAKLISCFLCIFLLVIQLYVVTYAFLHHNLMYITIAGLISIYFAISAVIYIVLFIFRKDRLVDWVFAASLVAEFALLLLF
jgi:hypothetical protein